jgi:Leucine-rich repeat (LRR) protein
VLTRIVSECSKSLLRELRLGCTRFSIDPSWYVHLDCLDLSGCGLEAIPKELQLTRRLSTLQLENNLIDDLSMLPFWPKLRLVGLARNRLKDVFHVRDIIVQLPCLSILDVRY